MSNQTFILASIVLCSLGGWYVVITKYLAVKDMMNNSDDETLEHVPGMGPPPLSPTPFSIPPDLLVNNGSGMGLPKAPSTPQANKPSIPPTTTNEKREICNQACVLHLLGFAIIAGIPFLNVILPAIFWLWIKERHPFLAKHGREVINFQITFTVIQLVCLGVGVLFIRYMPVYASKLLDFTKIARIVFSSGMYVPFNVFTMVPFFWACIVMIRGCVAAYHGISFKYPASQQFLFAHEPAPRTHNPNQMPEDNEPTPAVDPFTQPAPASNRVSFG